MSVGDLLARDAAGMHIDDVDHFVVWPKVVPVPQLARPDRWGDLDRARAGLIEDPPASPACAPYSPGDPLRRVHAAYAARAWRAHDQALRALARTRRPAGARHPDVGRPGLGHRRPWRPGRRGAVRGRCVTRQLVGSRRLVLRLDGGRLHPDNDALCRRRHRPRRPSRRPRAGYAGATVTVPGGIPSRCCWRAFRAASAKQRRS